MTPSSVSQSKAIPLAPSTISLVYALFALAMALTVVGVYFGILYAPTLLRSGVAFGLLFLQLILMFTSGWWVRSKPLNIILFAVFPLCSGVTLTPFLLSVLQEYANGASILLNGLIATVCMVGASAVLARMSGINLAGLAGVLLLSLLGLVALTIMQIFVPTLQTGGFELFLSGFGVILFAIFTAYDLQRITVMGKLGANPFQLALGLYLDIFNLFVSIVRFMLAISGDRR